MSPPPQAASGGSMIYHGKPTIRALSAIRRSEPQHAFHFFPLPHGQGLFRPILAAAGFSGCSRGGLAGRGFERVTAAAVFARAMPAAAGFSGCWLAMAGFAGCWRAAAVFAGFERVTAGVSASFRFAHRLRIFARAAAVFAGELLFPRAEK